MRVGGAMLMTQYPASIRTIRRERGQRLHRWGTADPRTVGIPHGVPASGRRVLASVFRPPDMVELQLSHERNPGALASSMRHLPTVDELDRIPTAELIDYLSDRLRPV